MKYGNSYEKVCYLLIDSNRLIKYVYLVIFQACDPCKEQGVAACSMELLLSSLYKLPLYKSRFIVFISCQHSHVQICCKHTDVEKVGTT